MGAPQLQKKTASLCETAAEQIGERLTSLIGSEVTFTVKGIIPLQPGELASKVRKKSAVVLLESTGGYGQSILVFRIPDAILFAGTLLMMPPGQVAEIAKAGEMEADLADAFTEVANILYGAMDDLAVKYSPEKGKLRSEGIQLGDPSQEQEFQALCPPGPAFCAELTMSFPGFNPGSIFLVLEDSLLSALFDIPLVSGVSAPHGENRSVLFFGKDGSIAGGIEIFLKSLGIETRTTTDIDQAVEWVSTSPMLVLAEFTDTLDGNAGRLCRAAAGKGKEIPVVGISDRPTRETILEARRAGVRAFLVHPFTPELLQKKMGPYLETGVKA
jgi:CheY-like chemotaxis protein